MPKQKLSNYGDGVAKFYEKVDRKKNVKSLDDLEYLGFQYFEEMGKRQEDVEFAQQKGKQLTLKIETPDNPNINSDMNVVVEDVIYSVIYYDRDRENRKLYLYLEEVRRIDRDD